MKTLTERIAHVMAAMHWTSAQEVATAAKVTRSAASQWLGKSSKPIYTMGARSAFHLAQATGFSARWLSSGEGPERPLHGAGHLVAAEPAPVSLDAALDRIGTTLARHMPPRHRDELADAMHGWAKHEGSERYRRVVADLLGTPAGGLGKHLAA
jgi:transcriptional regulator with XRE-family HTH domain